MRGLRCHAPMAVIGGRMILYFLGRPVTTAGPCDDGWVWGSEPGKCDAWYWAMQLETTPWGEAKHAR